MREAVQMSGGTVTGSDGADNVAARNALKRNVCRDAVAGAFLLLGLVLPWNVYFGVGIDGTTGWVFALLVVATLFSLGALAVTHVGPRSLQRAGVDPEGSARLRLSLSLPYLLLAVGFVVFTIVGAFAGGGTASVPPGIGPGTWFGVAGAVLAAQRVITPGDGEIPAYAPTAGRLLALASVVLGVVAVLFTLYWRTRFVAPFIGDDETGTQNLVVFVAAFLYGVAALAPVIVVSRWLAAVDRASRLVTVLIGSSALFAGAFVWILPVGRDLDSFHGIAQSTSTAGVGFEGYLAWVAAAAIVATPTVLGALAGESPSIWRAAVRKCLVLIAIWCGSSAVLRIVDLASASVLDLPAPAYNGIAVMAFDLVVALLAMWLFINSGGGVTPRPLMALFFGILFVLSVARVVVGVALVPRIRPLNATDVNAVYGNTLSQQITSTFDVALAVVALALLVISFVFANVRTVAAGPPSAPVKQEPVTQILPGPELSGQTEQFAAPELWSPPLEPSIAPVTTHTSTPTTQLTPNASASGAPDRVAEVLAKSTQRFAAGTTYGTTGASNEEHAGDSDR
jgi:hypothetical protein